MRWMACGGWHAGMHIAAQKGLGAALSMAPSMALSCCAQMRHTFLKDYIKNRNGFTYEIACIAPAPWSVQGSAWMSLSRASAYDQVIK